jgi:pyruvate-ferredoxin/flavodoxin oxidoreductase
MAGFVACHQTVFTERYDLLAHAAPGGVFLLNTPEAAEQGVGQPARGDARADRRERPAPVGHRRLRVAAQEAGMGRRINTIMQTCFFAISGILPKDEAMSRDQEGGGQDLRQEEQAPGGSEPPCHRHDAGESASKFPSVGKEGVGGMSTTALRKCRESPPSPPASQGEGDSRLRARRHPADLPRPRRPLPVSAMPADGTFPVGTAQYEKRNIALEIPVWEADLCTQCGKCVFVCPHSAIRARAFPLNGRRRAAHLQARAGAQQGLSRPAPTSATRWRRRTAPAAAIASKPARSTTSPTSAAAPSTWRRRRRCASRNATTTPSS